MERNKRSEYESGGRVTDEKKQGFIAQCFNSVDYLNFAVLSWVWDVKESITHQKCLNTLVDGDDGAPMFEKEHLLNPMVDKTW